MKNASVTATALALPTLACGTADRTRTGDAAGST